MRNRRKKIIGRIGIFLLAGMLAGCANNKASSKTAAPKPASGKETVLDQGYAALENQQYGEAIAKADEFLAGKPQGKAGSAEALYLKGRSFEGMNTAGVTPAESRENLQSARTAYIAALEQNPKQPLQSYIRASLGNVLYFQDDFQTAIAQFRAAYEKLDHDDLKAWAMYRVGLCQQRQGQFEQADKTFASVQEIYPTAAPARYAKEHAGARGFYVQLATFSTQAAADRAAAELQEKGVTVSRLNDSQGRGLIRVGPIASYTQAQSVKSKYAATYPEAIIIP